MSTRTSAAKQRPSAEARRTRLKGWIPPLLLISPSIVLIAVFVYGFIGLNINQSMTDAHNAAKVTGRRPTEFVGLDNYIALLTSESFQHSLMNLLLFTVAFLGGTMIIGFVWAWLLERPMKGEAVFRSVYLFPMAVSFVASGVVWKWLLNSNEGEQASGLNRLFQMIGLDFLQNPWWTHVSLGILAIALPAVWQLSGYVMALFLAGFRGIPDELREAARIDGASEWQMYRHVLFPQLSPIALSALIIIGHMSLKSFDLIMSISNQSAYSTVVPAVDMYNFKTTYDYANSAAVGAILLLIVAVLVVPYLINEARTRSSR